MYCPSCVLPFSLSSGGLMAQTKSISNTTNHFCQESVYLPNVSKYINQIDLPIKQPTYLNRKYRARRYKWPVQQPENLPLTYGIQSESMKFKHEDPYASSSSDSSCLYMPLANLKTTFKTTRKLHSKTWSAKHQPPPFPAPALTQVAVAHHVFGPGAQPSPRVRHEIIQLPHGEGDVVFVDAAVMSESLCDPLPQAPQRLVNQRNPNKLSTCWVPRFVAQKEKEPRVFCIKHQLLILLATLCLLECSNNALLAALYG